MWSEWFGQWIFTWCESRIDTLVCLSRFGWDWKLIFWPSLSAIPYAYSKINAFGRDLRSPQASSHSTSVIASITHTQKSSHSRTIIRTGIAYHKMFAFGTRFSLHLKRWYFVKAKMALNHVFLEYGEDGVPTRNLWSFAYDRIPFKSGSFELTDGFFHFCKMKIDQGITVVSPWRAWILCSGIPIKEPCLFAIAQNGSRRFSSRWVASYLGWWTLVPWTRGFLGLVAVLGNANTLAIHSCSICFSYALYL